LTLALIFAWLVGAIAILVAAMNLSLVRVTPEEFALRVDAETKLTAEERARQKSTFEVYSAALQKAEGRVVPLAVAELLLGASMVLFAQRAGAGRPWARQALIQLTVAHVGLSFLEWKITPDIRVPEEEWHLAVDNVDRQDMPVGASKLIQLGFLVGVSALSVLGLTRRRSRAFYELSEASE
jgi:hypothetical protein